MATQRFKVGIVGLQPGRSWASRAHVSALRALSETFDIVGVANTSRASAEAAAAEAGLQRAFDSVAALVASPDVDIVTVAVKVPHHLTIVTAALEAGKHVYCEWPLGNSVAEAQEMARLVREKGLLGVVGTQAPFAPEIEYIRRLIADGYVGEILSTTLVGYGGTLQGSGHIPDRKTYGYLLDKANGATLLTVPVGHAFTALTSLLGKVSKVSGVLATRRTMALVEDDGDQLPVSAPDQVLVSGMLASGAPLSIHYRGGAPRAGAGLLWEINGTKGDLRITGPTGHVQMVPLSIAGVREGESDYQPLAVPFAYHAGWPKEVEPGNVARVYAAMAEDLCRGTKIAPDFDYAVGLHRILAAIEGAADGGVSLD